MNADVLRSVEASELEAVEGGVVTLEYLVLGTILALGVIVGITAVTASRQTTGSLSATRTGR